MKRNLRTLALLVFSFMGIGLSSALQQNSFKVYKSDGSVDVIFFEKLDSITYTKIDLDGNLHDEIKTQEIHTADSLYRYAINEIDSVSFQPLPTIYKNGIVKVEGTLRDYVIGSESLNLFLRLDCPEHLMPKRGENVATLECDETLPSGFIGKVESIEHGDDKIIIVCTQASLTDIFESLELTVSATSEPEGTPTRAFGDLIWPPRHFNLTLPSIKGSVALSDVKKAGDLSGEYNMTSSLELNTEKFEVNVALMIRPRPIVPEVYFSYTSTGSHNLSLGSSLSSSLKYEHEFPIEKFRNIRIPGVPVIELFEEGGLFVSLEGSFGLDGTYTKPFKTITHFTFDNTKPVSIPPMLKVMGEDSEIETKLEGEVKAALGLYLKFGVGALVKEAANVDVDFKVGPEFSSTVDLTTSSAPITVRNTDMYDMMNRDDFFKVDLTASASVSASLFDSTKLSGTAEFGDLFLKNPLMTRGVVPEFKNMKLEEVETPGVLDASVSLYRKLMFPTQVGLALYDDNDNLVDSWWSEDKYRNNEGWSMSHQFNKLDVNRKYIVHPITRFLKDNMVANPSSDYTITPILHTGSVSSVTQSSATLSGKIENISSDMGLEYGIILDESIYKISSNMEVDGTFTVDVTNLEPESTHTFRTYLKTVTGILTSEESMSFTTEAAESFPHVDISDVNYYRLPDYMLVKLPELPDGIDPRDVFGNGYAVDENGIESFLLASTGAILYPKLGFCIAFPLKDNTKSLRYNLQYNISGDGYVDISDYTTVEVGNCNPHIYTPDIQLGSEKQGSGSVNDNGNVYKWEDTMTTYFVPFPTVEGLPFNGQELVIYGLGEQYPCLPRASVLITENADILQDLKASGRGFYTEPHAYDFMVEPRHFESAIPGNAFLDGNNGPSLSLGESKTYYYMSVLGKESWIDGGTEIWSCGEIKSFTVSYKRTYTDD